jgi:hypothetical protein
MAQTKPRAQQMPGNKASREEGSQPQHRATHGTWTSRKALERYQNLSETFDTMTFSVDRPLTFATVPWPILQPPHSITTKDIDWKAVEKFFKAVKPYLQVRDYQSLVQASHRRFHPDRWRARALLTTVADDVERSRLEKAANAVSQVLTPLWKSSKI